MGQEASKPQPGTKLRVIGAGLARTGTASFSEALSILLDGPVYHGGTQVCLGGRGDIKKFIKCYERTPIRNSRDKEAIEKTFRGVLDGYAATTDTPGGQFVPELMEMYPDAIVICTVRDPDAWAKSIGQTASNSLLWFLRIVLFPLPDMRYFPRYLDAMQEGRYGELYYDPRDYECDVQPFYRCTKHPHLYGRPVWDRHIEWLKKIVPKDKLFFFDVRDGWEPLCKALRVDVPEGIPFPRINDATAMDEFAKDQINRGLKAWAKIFGIAIVLSGIAYVALRN